MPRCQLLAVLALVLLAIPVVAQETRVPKPETLRTIEEAAQRLIRAGSDPAQVALVFSELGLDAYQLADELFARCDDSKVDNAANKALVILLEVLAKEPRYAGLPSAVATWRARDADARERERRIRETLSGMHAATERQESATVLTLAARVAEDARRAEASVSAVGVFNVQANTLLGLNRLDEYRSVMEDLRRAAASAGWSSVEAYSLIWIGESLVRSRRFGEAEASYARAAELAIGIGATYRTAQAHAGIAQSAHERGDPERARAEALKAYGILANAAHDREGVLSSLADTLADVGAFVDARAAARRAIEFARRDGDRLRERSCLVLLGGLAVVNGAISEALGILERAQAVPDLPPDPALLGQLGIAHARLGDHSRAIGFFRSGLAAVGDPDPNFHRGSLLVSLGSELGVTGRRAEAAEVFERAVIAARLAERPAAEAGALSARARVLGLIDREVEARELFLEALPLLEQHAPPRQRILARIGYATVLDRLGESADARRMLDVAVREARADRLLTAEAEGLAATARVLLTTGDFAGARSAIRRALELRLSLDSGLEDDEGLTLRDDHRSLADLGLRATLSSIAQPGGEAALAEEALWFIEAGRSLRLAEQLVNRRAIRDKTLSESARLRVAEAEDQVRLGRTHLSALLLGIPVESVKIVTARNAVVAASAALESLRSAEARKARGYATLIAAAPVDLSTLRQRLREDEAMIVFHEPPAEGKLHAIVVDSASITLHALGDAAATREAVLDWRAVAEARAPSEAAVARRLFESVARRIFYRLEGRRRLIVVPDGSLARLPFEVLLQPGRNGVDTRLVERFEISYAPSATVFAALDRSSPRQAEGLLAIADPDYERDSSAKFVGSGGRSPQGFPPLPETRIEVEGLAKLFEGERRVILAGKEARRERLLELLRKDDAKWFAVHFACHGVVDEFIPSLSGLVLSGGEVMGIEDLHGIEIPAAVTVLSACDSARGPSTRGEGVLGLVRAVFRAGCSRVVASSWRVGDAAAQRFMFAFYAEMLKAPRDPSRALTVVKREALRRGGADGDPIAWAAFVFFGAPGPVSP